MTISSYSAYPPEALPPDATGLRPTAADAGRQTWSSELVGEFWFEGHHITVRLQGDRLWAERSEDPRRFHTPLHRLVYFLRGLLGRFGVEGGRAWVLGERQGTELTGMAMARARRAEVADLLRRRGEASVAMQAPPPAPPSSGLAVLPPNVVDIIAGFLPLADRLTLRRCVSRALRDGGRQALLADLALRRAEEVRTVSQLRSQLSALNEGVPNAGTKPLSPGQKAAVLEVLTRQVFTWPAAMRRLAFDPLLAAAMTLETDALKAAALATIVTSARRRSDDSLLPRLCAAMHRLPGDIAIEPRVALLQYAATVWRGPDWDDYREAGDLATLLPPRKSWLDMVRPLSPARRAAALVAILRFAALQSGQKDYVDAWRKTLDETLRRATAESMVWALSALGRALPGKGATAQCWKDILDATRALPVSDRLTVMLALADSLHDLPIDGRVYQIVDLHMAGDRLPAGQAIGVRARGLSGLPLAARAGAWEALWLDWRRNDLQAEQKVAHGILAIHALGCVPRVDGTHGWPQGWQLVVQTCRANVSLPPSGRAALLMALDDLFRALVRHSCGRLSNPSPGVYATRDEAGEVALLLARDHGELRPLAQYADSLNPASTEILLAVLSRLSAEDRAAWLTPLLQGLRRLGTPDEWVTMAMALAQDAAVGIARRVPLMVALVDRCVRFRLFKTGGLLPMVRRVDVAHAPEILAGLAALADGMARDALRGWRSPVAYEHGPFMEDVWDLTLRLPPAGIRTMLEGLLRRKTVGPGQQPGGYDEPHIWAWSTLAHAVKATQRLAGRSTDIVARLARIAVSADLRSHRPAMDRGAARTRELIWEAITSLPIGERARALSELPLWQTDPPRFWGHWAVFEPAFVEQCRHLTEWDRPGAS